MKTRNGFFRLIKIAGRKKWYMIAAILLAVISVILQFSPFVLIYLIITELVEYFVYATPLDSSYIWSLGIFSLVAVAVSALFQYLSLVLSHIAAYNILYEIRIAIAEKLEWLGMGYFTQRMTGGIKKILSEDVERIELFVAHHIVDIISGLVLPLVTLSYMFVIDWRLGIAALLPIPLAFMTHISLFSSEKSVNMQRQYHDSLEKMNGTITEYVRGMQVIKIFNQTVDAFRRFKDDVYAYRDFTLAWIKMTSNSHGGFLAFISSCLIFIIPVSVFMLTRVPAYEDYVSVVFLFLILGVGVTLPLFRLSFVGGMMSQIAEGLDRVEGVLHTEEIPETADPKHPEDYSIEFSNVYFSYGDDSVLKDVSFTVKAGSVTALVGPSGAGKSTIGQLIPRFWDIQRGQIRIGNTDIRDIPKAELMDMVAFVFQDAFMFSDTIENNIRMGNRDAPEEDIVKAAKAAMIHNFITGLPQGYQTMVGGGGIHLSGGEQQRISIARIILKNAPIVILDEATAYADPENESQIQAAFSELIQDKSVIVIAHRLSTIADADQILVIDRGRIAQAGRHDELVRRQGLYQSMWQAHVRSRDWVLLSKGGAKNA